MKLKIIQKKTNQMSGYEVFITIFCFIVVWAAFRACVYYSGALEKMEEEREEIIDRLERAVELIETHNVVTHDFGVIEIKKIINDLYK